MHPTDLRSIFLSRIKGVPLQVPEEASDTDIDELFKSLNLDELVKPYKCTDDLCNTYPIAVFKEHISL